MLRVIVIQIIVFPISKISLHFICIFYLYIILEIYIISWKHFMLYTFILETNQRKSFFIKSDQFPTNILPLSKSSVQL